jgi:hypothetical protein
VTLLFVFSGLLVWIARFEVQIGNKKGVKGEHKDSVTLQVSVVHEKTQTGWFLCRFLYCMTTQRHWGSFADFVYFVTTQRHWGSFADFVYFVTTQRHWGSFADFVYFITTQRHWGSFADFVYFITTHRHWGSFADFSIS